MTGDTIAAIATASGIGGVGIVRISGPRAIDIARDVLGVASLTRAVRGTKVTVRAVMALSSDGPRAAASAMASSTPVKAISPSMQRMTTPSTQRT